ncbi:uncharacterized protein LOC124836281 [Vigna umbellata]|uniref:uncharacterized protein LOC124836281 n=1 Tax=Vigna umbellata TaxID=87088 RepID=UPI001F5E69A1|nr:uncharacterized protein LOC124836281 [Vigna umbellata]
MGLRTSKLNAAKGEGVPAKVIPKVVAKFEDFKKQRNAESTLSKKELLKHDDAEDSNSQSSPENDSGHKVSSSQEIQKPREEMVTKVTAAEKLSRVAPVPNSEGRIMEENHPNKDNTEQVNRDMDSYQDKLNHVVTMVVAEVKAEEEKSAKPEGEPRKEKDEQLGAKGDDDSDDEDRLIRPGSPSFRIYCIESEKIKESECNCPPIVKYRKTRSVDFVQTVASTNSNKVCRKSESTPKRKGNKKKFGSVKSLLKVRSCYHPRCMCNGDDRSFVPAKTTNR